MLSEQDSTNIARFHARNLQYPVASSRRQQGISGHVTLFVKSYTLAVFGGNKLLYSFSTLKMIVRQ